MATRPLTELFEEFMTEAQFVRLRRPATLLSYRRSFDTFRKLVPGVSLQLLNAATLTHFFQILQERKRVVGKGEIRTGIRHSTQASYWNKLSAFFSWLEEKKYLVENPLKKMHCPVPSYDDRKFLTKRQVQQILSAIHHLNHHPLVFKRNLAIFYFLLFCGLRREELVFLKTADIDLERDVLTVQAETSKSGRQRRIPLHPTLVFHLKEYLQERKNYTTPYVIVSSQRDDHFSYEGLKHLVNKLQKISGVPFHLHQFRHTFAVNYLKKSRDLSKLRQLLGHRDIKVTAVYLRNLPVDELRKDLEGLSIEEMI